ncbi:MAG TPA: galactokinase [Paludibaculum sp.]
MDRREIVAQLFRDHFGAEPRLWARAPGRVDLMGSHTDYNLGYVLTLPISRDTWIAARANGSREVRLHAANLNDSDAFALNRLDEAAPKRWTRYAQGVAFQLQAEGLPLAGFDAVIHSTVPLESGLSSSAALECATAVVFQELGGWQMEPKTMALLCQRAENEFVGVSCGILDQYSSCLGQSECALLLDCRDLSTRAVRLADGIGVVVCNTMSPRRLSGGEYAQRRADCELGASLLGVSALRDVTPETLAARRHELPGHVAKRCEFIVAESRRAESLAQALEAGDRLAVAQLCDDSFLGARDLYEISAPAMEAMRDAMLAARGVIGARQAGAGFGGCLVAIVEEAEAGAFADAVQQRYWEATQVCPEIYPVQAAPGANVFAREGRAQ